VTSLSNQLKVFDEVKESIFKMSTQDSGDKDKNTELIEQIKEISQSLNNGFLDINTQLSNLKAIQPINPLSTNFQTSIA
jgi:ATP phosphoribosyltransferase regulatory subunit HisZ